LYPSFINKYGETTQNGRIFDFSAPLSTKRDAQFIHLPAKRQTARHQFLQPSNQIYAYSQRDYEIKQICTSILCRQNMEMVRVIIISAPHHGDNDHAFGCIVAGHHYKTAGRFESTTDFQTYMQQ
jgi:hypothetical protein